MTFKGHGHGCGRSRWREQRDKKKKTMLIKQQREGQKLKCVDGFSLFCLQFVYFSLRIKIDFGHNSQKLSSEARLKLGPTHWTI